uniref:CSON004971 protein n=1 Tax=Culicoides sonorensis TaxID=179676 RepID=A0A336LY61_CULSO
MDDTNTANRRSLELNEKNAAVPSSVTSESVKESYRSIDPDDEGKEKTDPEKRTSMVRDSIENANDGADEKMLGDETEKLAQKEIEVKFIQGADVNGDAQIDIGDVKQVFK